MSRHDLKWNRLEDIFFGYCHISFGEYQLSFHGNLYEAAKTYGQMVMVYIKWHCRMQDYRLNLVDIRNISTFASMA